MLKKMMVLSVGAAAATAMSIPIAAQSTATLLDQINIPNTSDTPISLSFFATATSSTLSFAGYNAYDGTYLLTTNLQLNGTGSNLLTGNSTFTPAPSGSFASTNASNEFFFLGTTPGDYDTFSTDVATVAGDEYTLDFDLFTDGTPSALRITASNASLTPLLSLAAAVPEPATWAMMILGVGAIGFSLRRSKVATRVFYSA